MIHLICPNPALDRTLLVEKIEQFRLTKEQLDESWLMIQSIRFSFITTKSEETLFPNFQLQTLQWTVEVACSALPCTKSKRNDYRRVKPANLLTCWFLYFKKLFNICLIYANHGVNGQQVVHRQNIFSRLGTCFFWLVLVKKGQLLAEFCYWLCLF